MASTWLTILYKPDCYSITIIAGGNVPVFTHMLQTRKKFSNTATPCQYQVCQNIRNTFLTILVILSIFHLLDIFLSNEFLKMICIMLSHENPHSEGSNDEIVKWCLSRLSLRSLSPSLVDTTWSGASGSWVISLMVRLKRESSCEISQINQESDLHGTTVVQDRHIICNMNDSLCTAL